MNVNSPSINDRRFVGALASGLVLKNGFFRLLRSACSPFSRAHTKKDVKRFVNSTFSAAAACLDDWTSRDYGDWTRHRNFFPELIFAWFSGSANNENKKRLITELCNWETAETALIPGSCIETFELPCFDKLAFYCTVGSWSYYASHTHTHSIEPIESIYNNKKPKSVVVRALFNVVKWQENHASQQAKPIMCYFLFSSFYSPDPFALLS